MTSSNKARRYLQHHKHGPTESFQSQQSIAQLLIVDPTASNAAMRKFRGKIQPQPSTTSTSTVPIPQICVHNNDDENNDDDDDNHDDDESSDHQHVAILNEFDQVLENELKRTSVLRTLSLKQSESIGCMGVPISQQRSFSFALGSKTNLQAENLDDNDDEDDDSMSTSLAKGRKVPSTPKSTLSKDTFTRLFQSLTFRSANHSPSKTPVNKIDMQQQHPCLACLNYPGVDLTSKTKKRPSIFGVLVAKLNTSSSSSSMGNTTKRCVVCKRFLSNSVSSNDDNQELSTAKTLRDPKQSLPQTKRRRSLPSLLHNLLESTTSTQHRPSFSTALNHILLGNTHHEPMQSSALSESFDSLTESDDSSDPHCNHNHHNSVQQRQRINYDDPSQLAEKSGNKDENDNDVTYDNSDSHDLNIMNSNDSANEHNTNQQYLHPPEEKTRSLLVNVFRTRRSNAVLDSTEANIVGKQFSASAINLATSMGIHRRNSAISTINEITLDQRKHAASEENLLAMDNTFIYFTNINGQNFKEKLNYSATSENTTLREMLIKLFEKYNLSIDTYNICLRNAPNLPLSLDQPVKHLLLDDLVVTEVTNRLTAKTSAGKERAEKRNSISSAILSLNSKSTSKRLSSHGMTFDNEDSQDSKAINQQQQQQQPHSRTNKTNRSSLFASSIFTRDTVDSTERVESNISFIRRKCDEWQTHGLPKLAQLQFSIDDCDLAIEKEWQPFLNEQARTLMTETIKLQQEAIYEMLSTEVSYIRQILTMTDIFMTSISILKSSQRDGIFNEIDMDKLFSNIQDVLHGNLLFWKEILLPIKLKLQQTGLSMNPSDLKNGFLRFDSYFKPYLHYVLDQKSSAEYFKQKFARDDLFQYLITWIEANFTNRLSFSDLTIKPLQRLTRYKLLLEAIQKKTLDNQQKSDLQEMIQKVATFVNRVNLKLHKQEQEERVRQVNDHIGPFDYVSAPPELSSILQEYNRDSMSNRLNLLEDMPLHIRGYRRQIIQQGPMKMKDSKNNQDVYCYLFSDMFLITKSGKRSGSTSSTLSGMSSDGQSTRGTSNILNKILKSPIRIDRIDVREYDRRGGSNNNAEPNTASFVAIVFSEYNLIESAYLFQTNLSKQWIENIRRTKENFQLLMEESKLKYNNIHLHKMVSCCSPTTNAIHQSLPSLSMPSMDTSSVKSDDSDSLKEESRRLSKVESDVFRSAEQSRRNSRVDRRNFGRYFTADGTSTHTTTPASPPIKQMLSSSTTIIKRMSWNNDQIMEKNDSSIITNSFRSVHSSSGVSSTGSFLFSADEDSSMTTGSSSIPSIVPSLKSEELDGKSLASTVVETDDSIESSSKNEQTNPIVDDSPKVLLQSKNSLPTITQISPSSTSTLLSKNQVITEASSSITTDLSSPESSLRRIPYPSVRKRNQNNLRSGLHQQSCDRHRLHHSKDVDASTNKVTFDLSRPNDDDEPTKSRLNSSLDNLSLVSSENESDYDNDQSTNVKKPVSDTEHSNELTRTDDSLLNHQNNIIINTNGPTESLNNNNNPQSDITQITTNDSSHRTNMTTTINSNSTLDNNPPSNFISYHKDPIMTRRLLDIRSHLLLNTTLDATEV